MNLNLYVINGLVWPGRIEIPVISLDKLSIGCHFTALNCNLITAWIFGNSVEVIGAQVYRFPHFVRLYAGAIGGVKRIDGIHLK